jgi:circadian clock protein KaiC
MTRISTGLPDLDLILGGGLVPGSVIVIAGEPGTGKTILAQQICFLNTTRNSKSVYYTMVSETHAKLVEHLGQLSFFTRTALGPTVEYIHLGELLHTDDLSKATLVSLVAEIVRKTEETRPGFVVLDSIRLLRNLFSENEIRVALYDLAARVTESQAVLFLIGEYAPHEMQMGPEFAIADGILHLAHEPREPLDRRWLRVVKMRGGSHREGKHTFHITNDGLEVFPRIETLLPTVMPDFSGRIVSGIPGLDDLLGGGIPTGDATLVMGSSGAGKTIFSLGFVDEGLVQGERCLYITFQDTADQLVGMAAGFGWDFESARTAGHLAIEHVPMGALDLDVLVAVVRRHLSGGQFHRVVIDSLAEMVFSAREGERFPAYLRSLNGLIRSFGASLLVTSETTTLGPTEVPLGGLMFLFHNVIQIRYVEQHASVGRVLNILKMRKSPHDAGIHLCSITADGLRIGERLEGLTGVLGWSVLRERFDATTPPHSEVGRHLDHE